MTIKFDTNALTVTTGEMVDGEVVVDVTVTGEEHDKAVVFHQESRNYLHALGGEMTKQIATIGKEQFGESDDVDVVSGTYDFGGTTLSTTVHRSYQVGEEDPINNYVVFGCEDDFTTTVNDAVAGIFEE